MDGRCHRTDNVFTERSWRSLKYCVYLICVREPAVQAEQASVGGPATTTPILPRSVFEVGRCLIQTILVCPPINTGIGKLARRRNLVRPECQRWREKRSAGENAVKQSAPTLQSGRP